MEQYISSFDGTQLFCIHHPGTEPITLVFLHGIGGNWTIWKKEIEFFKSKGYPILTQDLRGHGKSEYSQESHPYTLPSFARDLKTVIETHKIKNFALIGHSLGGSIGITYCMQYHTPYPESLILIETPATYPFQHDRLLNYNSYLTHLARYLAEHTEVKNRHFTSLNDIDLSEPGIKTKFNIIRYLLHIAPIKVIVETLDNIEQFIHKNQKRVDLTLHHLKIPTLLIAGDQDSTVPLEYSKYIHHLNKASELRIIKNGHHKITAERPKEVCQILYHFVKNKLQIVPHMHLTQMKTQNQKQRVGKGNKTTKIKHNAGKKLTSTQRQT